MFRSTMELVESKTTQSISREYKLFWTDTRNGIRKPLVKPYHTSSVKRKLTLASIFILCWEQWYSENIIQIGVISSKAFVHPGSQYIGKISTLAFIYGGYLFAQRHQQAYNLARFTQNFDVFPIDIQRMIDNHDSRYAYRWMQPDYLQIEPRANWSINK